MIDNQPGKGCSEKFEINKLRSIAFKVIICTFAVWLLIGNFQGISSIKRQDTQLLSRIAPHFQVGQGTKQTFVRRKQQQHVFEEKLQPKIRLKRELQNSRSRFHNLLSNQNQETSSENKNFNDKASSHSEDLSFGSFDLFKNHFENNTSLEASTAANHKSKEWYRQLQTIEGSAEKQSKMSPTPSNFDPYSNVEDNFTENDSGFLNSQHSHQKNHLTQLRDFSGGLLSEGFVHQSRLENQNPVKLKNNLIQNTTTLHSTRSSLTVFRFVTTTLYEKASEPSIESTAAIQSTSVKSTQLTNQQLILIIVVPVIVFFILMAILVLYLVKVKWKPRRRIDIEKTPSPHNSASISSSTASWHTSQRNSPIPPPDIASQANGNQVPANAWANTNARDTSTTSS